MDAADRIYLEADNSCAMCGCRESQALTIHHIDNGPENDVYENKILLCYNCHQRFHDGRGLTREEIVKQKWRLIVKTITQYGLNAMTIAERNSVGVLAFPFLLYHLVELNYMKKEEEWDVAGVSANDASAGTRGEMEVTARFTITDRGRKAIHKHLE